MRYLLLLTMLVMIFPSCDKQIPEPGDFEFYLPINKLFTEELPNVYIVKHTISFECKTVNGITLPSGTQVTGNLILNGVSIKELLGRKALVLNIEGTLKIKLISR